MVRTPTPKGNTMTIRFEAIQRVAFSAVASLFVTVLLFSAAAPVLPVA